MPKKKKHQQKSSQVTRGGMTVRSNATFELFGETWNGISDVLSNARTTSWREQNYLNNENARSNKEDRALYNMMAYEGHGPGKKRKKSKRKCSVVDCCDRVPCFDFDDYATDYRRNHSITIYGGIGETATINYTDGDSQITIRIH